MADPLADLLAAAVAGAPPEVDFQTVLLPRPQGPTSAVLGFTGHHVVAADVDRSWLDEVRDVDDFAAVLRAPFLAALGSRIGARVGHLDVVLVARHPATEEAAARERGDPPGQPVELIEVDAAGDAHGRVRRALTYRRDVRAYLTPDGAGRVMVGRGLADRWEISFEVEPCARGRGLGTALASAGPGLVPYGQPVFAQVSPGNVASLRVLLAAGFRPIGSEVLLLHGNDHVYQR